MSGDVGITAMDGILPGCPDLDAYWERVQAARVAPLTPLGPRWGVPRQHYWPQLVHLDEAFCIESMAGAGPLGDRQASLAHAVIGRLLAQREARGPLQRDGVALVAGTSWPGDSYFEHDATRVLGGMNIPAPWPSLPATYFGYDDLLDGLASAHRLGATRLAVDTACASSLYALDIGLGLLRSGQARAVVVLGLNAFLPIFMFTGFSRLGALSKTGKILPFSEAATGIVPAEAAGAVLLEPLDAGEAQPLAVVRSLALSADGSDRSVLAVGPEGQRLMFQRAYADLNPGEIDYLEAHGTGTKLGDDTELECIEAFFGPHRKLGKLPVGSSKALVGHALAAAGMVSLLKALLMLREGVLPPHVAVTPHPLFPRSSLTLLREAVAWPDAGRPRRVGISAMGIGAANGHAVLESPPAPAHKRPARRKMEPMQLAIVDAEVALAGGIGVDAFRRAIEAGRTAETPLPAKRLGFELGFEGPPPRGAFLPERFAVESEGLRIGPKFLTRLDPFQLLLLHLVHRLLSRQPQVDDAPTTGVVVTSNLGGGLSLRVGRKGAMARFASKARAFPDPWFAPESALSMEGIASGNPNLSSGFPAFHHNLQAFHATLAGGPATFWRSLQLAPYWLLDRCAALLLGGGRFFKGPLDLERGAHAVPFGEGAGVFLLRDLREARARREPVLAILRAIVPAEQAGDWRGACRWADVDPERVTHVEVSQTHGAAMAKPAAPTTQSATGFLAEATGIEALARVLLRPGCSVIEIRERERLVASLVLEAEQGLQERSVPSVRPVEIVLSPLAADAPPEDTASPGGTQIADLLAASEANATGVHIFLEEQRRRLLGASRTVTERTLDPDELPKDRAVDLASLVSELAERASRVRARPLHRVLERIEVDAAGLLSAQVRVDQDHPYFFDHPLDHVPGFLLVEAIQQLGELEASRSEEPQPTEPYLRSLHVRFHRFCEKQAPARVTLTRRGPAPELLQGMITQGGTKVCSFSFTHARAPAPSGEARQRRAPPADPTLLRKQRIENVVVGEVRVHPDERLSCELLAPPPDHVLADGSRYFYSPLFLLEGARQAIRLAIHELVGLRQGVAHNLLAVQVELTEPVPRAAHLELWGSRQDDVQLGGMSLSEFSCEIVAGGRKLGVCLIKSQMVDMETYEAQRWRA